ncbi:MAG: sulfurtransferase-like selenium metabolism protein YedF [Cloacibacillus porcorum]|uniref:sulfurtransferase-like selenium metabolism protein YedF n=1 Tax=Cloacibacillus porcorum TaxID=1197717 RepID=UPI0023EFC1D8|nr:sulfurtransferase-like selenium metabolism protein YedF [Cloacibacillus porcorum]MCD7876964.1 sulfurtransferase-like selenium metabolism protein YedF [Cloacibacillus porcorum]
MIEIDARKLECPKPVLLVKEEADKGTAQIRACVDNEVAAGNVTRFFESRGYTASRKDGAEGIYITGQKSGEAAAVQKNGEGRTAILFTSDKIGAPSDGLGEVLMKAYIGTLTKTTTPPSAVALMNEGVKMALPEASTLDTLKELEAAGTKILICGTCTKHFGITDQITIGTISNMFEISEAVFGADKPIVLG